MEEEGLIRRITGEDGADMYDASFVLHGHLICMGCRSVKDINTPDMLEKLSDICGEALSSFELKMRYLCESCRSSAER